MVPSNIATRDASALTKGASFFCWGASFFWEGGGQKIFFLI